MSSFDKILWKVLLKDIIMQMLMSDLLVPFHTKVSYKGDRK